MLRDVQGRLERRRVSNEERVLLDACGEGGSQLGSEQSNARNSSWGSQDEGEEKDKERDGEDGEETGFM